MKITSMMPAEPGYRAVFEVSEGVGECLDVKAWASVEDDIGTMEILPVVWSGAGMTVAIEVSEGFVGVLAPGEGLDLVDLDPVPTEQDEDKGPTGGFDA